MKLANMLLNLTFGCPVDFKEFRVDLFIDVQFTLN